MYNTIHNKFPHLELRLLLAVIISGLIIVTDKKLNILLPLKNYIEDSMYLLYCLCDKPRYILNFTLKRLSEYNNLIIENNMLRQELLLKKSELLLIEQYKKDNFKLYELINTPLILNKKKIITRVLFINTDPYNNTILINHGKINDIYIGQPVLTDKGIVGQVISTNKHTSRILLICDPKHALSVQIQRNDIRIILAGFGYNADLQAEHLGKIDVSIGDILVTSGLDGRFPEGYPVAIVSNIVKNAKKDLTIIQAHPTVKLQYLRYVILIWI
ncbi:rod shape-determining protein MreC [Candidatus Blochmannia ocreatus (nom. nud.)]|uniref:Cell shape-determining protein MreC n=1 Tax=Candidatus Blochmannia ocreatus (nom. nud.) TaxID=251538 RepID=A0ABY4STQ4_9ENTR|nr:rod shape-determining protein MreC [Candidatus Blochmannia ocreatus]URJ25356.1 rod shape-determining protein MreC [Candidatus Blochmannia ocreatus]